MKKHTKPPGPVFKTIRLAELPETLLNEATILGPKKNSRSARATRQVSEKQKKVKVMIVDDDASVANSAIGVLNLFGYECYAVYNAQDAIAAADSFQPDIVLSEVVMPGMNGIELCEQIRQMLPDCRVLLLSGEVAIAHTLIQDSHQQGYNFELVAKPVRPQELVAKIGHLFGGAYSPSNVQRIAHTP